MNFACNVKTRRNALQLFAVSRAVAIPSTLKHDELGEHYAGRGKEGDGRCACVCWGGGGGGGGLLPPQKHRRP